MPSLAMTPRTKTEVALSFIREQILAGDLEPGTRIRAEALATELGMSATPIREALRVLQADRLVHYRPHHGIVVAGISAPEVREIYVARLMLEGPTTAAATPALEGPALDRLEKIHARLVACRASRDIDIGSLNADWHWEIYRAAPSSYLMRFIEQLWDRFPWRTMWVRPEDRDRSIGHHERIMDAIRRGAAEEAGELMTDHVRSGSESLLRRTERESG
jgi:DNA-binding GntR family transcriptional regulator